MENIDLVYSFFNQHLYNDVKNNIDQIQYYFESNPSSQGNRLISELLGAIRTYPFESLDYPLFQSILMKTGKNQTEAAMILGEIEKWKRFSKEQVAPQKDMIQRLLCSNIIRKAGYLFKDDPVGYIRYLREANIRTGVWEPNMIAQDVSTFDIAQIKEEILTGGYRSYFQWFNETYEPNFLVPKGQVIVVSATPGTGKTLFCCTEAVNYALQGLKVHFLAMGDTKVSDFVSRCATVYSGLPFGEAYQNLDKISEDLFPRLADHLYTTIVPANQIKIDEYIEYIIQHKFDVCFIDYDSNFNTDDLNSTDGGLYKYYGQLYGSLSQLTQLGILVYICAQPKSGTYENEYFNEGMLGESRRKQEHADVVIGLTRRQGIPNSIGNICITKNRRGKLGSFPYIRLNNGRFKIIPPAVYQNISQLPEYRNYSEADIDILIHQHNLNMQRIQQQAPAVTGVQGMAKVNNVFTKKS